jgi:hypothetical protein
MAPGTPPEAWIEVNCRIIGSHAHLEARAISNLIDEFGLDRLLTEDITDLKDLNHIGMSKQRSMAVRHIRILEKYRDALVAGTAAVAGVRCDA